mgnify:CR=1 FL=1
MLINKIKEDMIKAMKEKEKAKLSTLRMLLAKVEKEKVALKLADVSDLTNEQVQSVISKNIKELDKEIESYVAVGRSTENQDTEKALLLTYLPTQLTEDQIRYEIFHAFNLVAQGKIKNPMQYLSKELKGKADMGLVARIAKEFKN